MILRDLKGQKRFRGILIRILPFLKIHFPHHGKKGDEKILSFHISKSRDVPSVKRQASLSKVLLKKMKPNNNSTFQDQTNSIFLYKHT
jgi:hypothetical protein